METTSAELKTTDPGTLAAFDEKMRADKVFARPWELPWYLPTPGNGKVLTHLVLLHALTITGIILFPWPGWKLLAVTLAFTALGGLGTTVVYHRTLSHRTIKLNKFVEHILIFFTLFNGS